jgi:hypothetical protein
VTSTTRQTIPPRASAWQLIRRLLMICSVLLLWPLAAAAEQIEVSEPRLEFSDGGWNLSANFDFELPSTLEDAINKGIPLYFVTEFELSRSRWYWFDEKPVSVARSVRLAFHPLTRQYRVSTGGLQIPFPRLKDALSFVKHVRGWRVFERQAVRPGTQYLGELRMRLDVTQLPKPFQVNAVNTSDWNLSSDWARFPVNLSEPPPAASLPASSGAASIASPAPEK